MFGLLFASFAIFWMAIAFTATGPSDQVGPSFALIGLPFLLVGLGIAVVPVLAQLRRSSRTSYAITDWRFISIMQGASREVRAIDLSRIISVTKTSRPDGSGSITLQVEGDLNLGPYYSRRMYMLGYLPGMTNISDVDAAYGILEQARVDAAGRKPDA